MEEETVMLIGRKEYKILGHFPPTPSDLCCASSSRAGEASDKA